MAGVNRCAACLGLLREDEPASSSASRAGPVVWLMVVLGFLLSFVAWTTTLVLFE